MSQSRVDTVAFLNELSLSDPTSAREEVVRLLQILGNSDREDFIRRLEAGAGSRLRQAVARAVQIAGFRVEMAPVLERWLPTETDEFTRVAIQDALAPDHRRDRRKPLLNDLEAVPRTFRYLTDRLRHRILNVMPGAGLSIANLKDVAALLTDEQLRLPLLTEVDRLSRIVSRLQRAVDFTDDREHFDLAKFDLVAWLESFAKTYRAQWPESEIRISYIATSVPVEAVPYLLEIAFANLLDNGRQAVGTAGWIEVAVKTARRSALITV